MVTKTLKHIYENGVVKVPAPFLQPDKMHVTVTIESEPMVEGKYGAHSFLAKASEHVLAKAWDNPADDIFNELLNG